MPPIFTSKREAVVYQLREEAAHRPFELLLRIGRTILKDPVATKEAVLASPVFREHIWEWLLACRRIDQTAEAQNNLDAALALDDLPDESDPEEPPDVPAEP